MTDDESSAKDWKKRSMLSMGTPASAARVGGTEAAMRHRLARARRESTPSPLLSALAAMEGFRPEPAVDRQEPERPNGSRWGLRYLLSLKQIFEKFDAAGRPGTKRPPEASATTIFPEMRREALPHRAPVDPAEFTPDQITDHATAIGEPDDARWRPLVDPMRVIGGIANSKTLILAATIVGGVIGVAVAVSTPKKYEAATELLVDPRDLKVSDRDLTQTGLTSDALLSLVENQVRVLTSSPVLNKVVDKLKLDEDPEFNGQGQGGVGNIFASLRALLAPGKAGGGDLRRVHAVGNLAESLTVERSGKTFIVTIGAKTEDPEKSARIANTVADVFVQTTGNLQSDTAGRAADELNARLAELRTGVEEAERAAEKFRAEHDLVGAQGRLISDDELVKLNDQLSVARARTIELNARAQSARSIKLDAVIGGGIPEELTSPVMSELRAQYAAIKQQADQLSVRLGPRHPQYVAMEAQLQGAREQIANELKRIVASAQTDLKRAIQQEQDLAARLAQLKLRSGDVNGDMITLRELEREVAAKRAVYENFLLRAKEAGEQRDINTANISVVSQAYPPLDPTGPSRASIAIVGAVLGFMAGVALGAGRGILWSLREKRQERPSARTPRQGNGGGRMSRNPDPMVGRSGRDEIRAEPRIAGEIDVAGSPLAGHAQRPHGRAQPAQPSFHAWQPQPTGADPYGYQQPAATAPYREPYLHDATRPEPHALEPQAASSPEQMSTIEEVRESLREFREAIRDLTDERARRRESARDSLLFPAERRRPFNAGESGKK
ncbi:GumC family protein [Mesorhizobium sp. BAC0120]|uniref:GumC family protein n=1 Tax=Mesorhizobium sp. BAC0120 TaxID=3090670 RepID=UPI00298BFAF1|nr:GumC family protein [Mesorhizobium sp. BAC0120]MDW6025098.1 GumC family protein [Mesorhizobium sp. BAC0120]